MRERNAKKFSNRLGNVSSKERWRKKRMGAPPGLKMMIETKMMRGLKWISPNC
jgi:hypothetical protein